VIGRSIVSRAAGVGVGIALLCGAAGQANAAIYNVDWMNYEPYVMNSQSAPLPTGQTFALVGMGNVRVD